MVRSLGVVLVASAFFLGSAGDCSAVMRAPLLGNGSAGVMSRGTSGGGLLARLNRPLVRPMPGMPTVSPLGLIAPRLSNAVSMFQLGGFRAPTGRLSALGVLSPRLSPIFGLVRMPPRTPQAQLTYGLAILSPRVAVLFEMLRASSGLVGGLR